MTTYRRFCCNDLLRFGALNLQFNSTTFVMNFYMRPMALWPGNCHVADTAGGRLTGYIFGSVKEEDEETTAMLSKISLRSMDMIHLGKQLSKLLEECCDKIYRAFAITFFISYNNSDKYLADELGYIKYKEHRLMLEMRKPLPLLIKLTEERIMSAPLII